MTLPEIHSVGVVDWTNQNYHAYKTPHGTSCNSFLIIDDQITLVDTVPQQLWFEHLSKIKKLIQDIKKITNIVIQHAELECCQCLPLIIQENPNIHIICTRKCYEHLIILFPQIQNAVFDICSSNTIMSTGKHQFTFFPTPLLHWPEQMMTFLNGKVAFTSDFMSQHLASTKTVVDLENSAIALDLCEEFLANEFAQVPEKVLLAINKIKELKIEQINPCKGVSISKEYIQKFLEIYDHFVSVVQQSLKKDKSTQQDTHLIQDDSTGKKIVIIYQTMWGATARMADFIAQYLKQKGYKAHLLDVKLIGLQKLAHESFDANAFAFGSPSLNDGALPGIIEALNYIRGLKLVENKPAIVFGSFGWGDGEGSKYLQKRLEEAGIVVKGRIIWKFNFEADVQEKMKKLLDEAFPE